jgi:NADH:ubiquinone oxidoreductase subunit F (NADH-binding)
VPRICRLADSFPVVGTVCINQQDVHERNEQVRFMGTLYREAECVHCWLGPTSQGTDLMTELVRKIESGIGKGKIESRLLNTLTKSTLPESRTRCTTLFTRYTKIQNSKVIAKLV